MILRNKITIQPLTSQNHKAHARLNRFEEGALVLHASGLKSHSKHCINFNKS